MAGIKAAPLWLWQLPQHLAALVLWGILRLAGRVVSVDRNSFFMGNIDTLILIKPPGFGVSLGQYIFVPEGCPDKTKRHEHGHSIQSRRLGPLYLIIVGIPSAVFNNLQDRLFHKSWPTQKRQEWYYSRWPEKQADRLGGVVRA